MFLSNRPRCPRARGEQDRSLRGQGSNGSRQVTRQSSALARLQTLSTVKPY